MSNRVKVATHAVHYTPWPPGRSMLSLRLVAVLGSIVLGCSGDTTGPAPLPAARAFWALELNARAVNLALTAPYNTVQLSATARTVAGTLVPDVGSIHYSDPDSSVAVNSTGLVTAHFVTARTNVVVTATVQGVTLTDTVLIRVTPTPLSAPLATFSIQPRPDGIDSAKFAVYGTQYTDPLGNSPPSPRLSVYATIATGDAATDTVCNVMACPLLVSFSSSDSTIATVDQSGYISPLYPGHVTFYVTTLAYGVSKQDSLPFVIGYPIDNSDCKILVHSRAAVGSLTSVLYFAPNTITCGVGAQMILINLNSEPIDLVFDDSTAILGSPKAIRVADSVMAPNNPYGGGWYFPAAGTYTFHSPTYGSSGKLIVSAGP